MCLGFQENTFSVDSLQQTLSLLNNLDRHSFTLLTSLTLGSRSRTRDFWVFRGPTEESDTPPVSPTDSSFETKREAALHKFSPLRQVTPSNSMGGNSKLRKPCPKGELPRAFQSVSSLNDQSVNGHGRLPSEVGSVDMTGVGTTHRRPASQTPTSDAFYATRPVMLGNSHQHDFNPWNRTLSPPQPQALPAQPSQFFAPSSWRRQHSRHYSISSTNDPILHGVIQESPYDIARQSSSSTDSKLRRASASSPLSSSYPPQPLQFTPTAESGPRARHSADGQRPHLTHFDPNPPRIPTPPLLGIQAFRDSGLSTGTGWRSTTEVPVTWTGKDPEPPASVAPLARPLSPSSRPVPVPHGPRERRSSTVGLQVPRPPQRRGSSGPGLPGACAGTPKEEQASNDVWVVVAPPGGTPPVRATNSSRSNTNSTMIPPTIREQPSQEGNESSTTEKRGQVQVRSPEQHRAEGEGARKSEAAFVGNIADRAGSYAHDRTASTVTNSMRPTTANGHPKGNGQPHPQRPPHAPRGASISEGWVLVNVDGSRKTSSSPRSSAQSSQAALLRHQRSQSDSRVPATTGTARGSPAGAANATMSAAAKAIAAADAMEQQTREKQQQSGSKLRRLLGRSTPKDKDKDKDGHNPEASTASQQSTKMSRVKPTQPVQTTCARK